MTWSIIFVKMKIFHFPAIKTDRWTKGCSSYYQSSALIIYNSQSMHNFVIWSLDRWIWSRLLALQKKKGFFEMRTFEAFKKAFLKCHQATSNPNFLKLLPILILFGASVMTFSTQKIYKIIKMYQVCLQNFFMES